MNWRYIKGFEGLYEVSESGHVRNSRTERVLKPYPFSNGYLGVQLGRGNVNLVHRLVAAAFINGDASLQVNHRNGVRTDNRAENLEWVTCSDNHRHSYRELSRKQHAKTTSVAVGGVRYPSQLAAAKAIGVVAGSIRSALVNKHKCLGMEVTA